MLSPNALPHITAPSVRTTTTSEQWVSYLKGDLKQVQNQARQWLVGTALEQVERQIQLGNSKQFTAVVDGSRSKPIVNAERRVVVYFVGAVLARNLQKAQDVLRRAILRVSKRRTGKLSNGWTWFLQRGGKGKALTRLGAVLPASLNLQGGDAVILAPRANYAWFVEYFGRRKAPFVPTELKKTKRKSRRKRPPRGTGYTAYAARQLRSELRQVGVSVWAVYSKKPPAAPFGTVSKYGVPILVFRVSKRVVQMRGDYRVQ